jgi:uncharacterized membrane protein
MAASKDKTHALVRLEMFSDAVIAVAITIMVLELKPPDISAIARQNRFDFSFLHHFAPKFLAYSVSFFVIATDWVILVTSFRRATRCTWQLLWLTLLHLFTVCLVPWAAAFVAENPTLPQAVAAYGAVGMLLLATASFVLRHLEALFPTTGSWLFKKNLIVVAIAGLSSASAFISVYLAFGIFALCTIIYFVPEQWQERLFRPKRPQDEAEPIREDGQPT